MKIYIDFNKIMWMLTIFFFLYACMGIGVYNKMSHLSSDELEWVDCYELNDSNYFISDLGNEDTMVIYRKDLDNSRFPFYFYTFDYSPGPDMSASAGYDFNIYNGDLKNEGGFFMRKIAYNDELNFAGIWGFIYVNFMNPRYGDIPLFPYTSTRLIYVGENSVKPQPVRLKDGKVIDCLIFKNPNKPIHNNPDTTKNPINNFAFGKGIGLLWYQYKSGERFVRKDLSDVL